MKKMIEKHQVWETKKEWYSALGLTTQSGSISVPRPEEQGQYLCGRGCLTWQRIVTNLRWMTQQGGGMGENLPISFSSSSDLLSVLYSSGSEGSSEPLVGTGQDGEDENGSGGASRHYIENTQEMWYNFKRQRNYLYTFQDCGYLWAGREGHMGASVIW